jgi:predicted nucleic acid-binding protein
LGVAERVLIDTGPIVAILSENDEHHNRCTDALAGLVPPLFTCWPVVTEAAWLLRKRPDTLTRMFDGFAGQFFALLSLDDEDLPAVAAMMKRYESAGLQLADVALAHLAERENIRTFFTTDRRDFSIVRLKRNRTLKLIPDMQ